jgi:two-component system phosphate regulon sensor histidine kinase PhoR
MTKSKTNLIITLLGICLAFIIVFQLYWINNAIAVKEKQFERTVNDVLTRVVDKLQTHQTVAFINNKIGPCQNIFDSLIVVGDIVKDSLKEAIKEIKKDEKIRKHKQNNDIKITINRDEQNNNCMAKVIDLTNINDSMARTMVILNNVADSISYKVKEAMIKVKESKFLQVMDKMILEYTTEELPVEKKISCQSTDSILKMELKNKDIDLPYEFAIVNGNNNEVSPVRSSGFNKEMLDTRFRVDLFPDEITEKSTELLMLFFPSKNNFILRSLWLVLLAALVFTLVIILTFAYTIKIILYQKKLSDIKTDFINNMTHEFKTPIATISLAVDSIANPKVIEDKGQILNYARIIKEENSRMNSHVEQVLQMALLDKKDLELNFEKTDVNDVILMAVEKVKLQISSRDGTVNVRMNASQSLVNADAGQLLNVFINLLDNAIKYSVDDPDITIETGNKGNTVTVCFSDKGIGLNREQQTKIFEKFYRVATGNVHNVKGFGLGLSYAKAIILAHGGSISVSGEPGKGSTFEILLPVIIKDNF